MMEHEIHHILKKYWGYDKFRPLQEDIIRSALDKKDTLALLPTGGGKSLCFQVPVLSQAGVGLVISPLIALMDDQVQRLRSMDIKAIALTSNLSYRELDVALDNAVNGYYKFLYLSPERLKSDLVRERIKRMDVNLLAVDEAHCISQWGYDFRPSYLQISEVRESLPHVPVLALTATATPKVVEDIQEKLMFREKNVFKKSFFRPNLFYNVLKKEDKWNYCLRILHKIPGTAIIYTRNRRRTVEIARWLRENGFSAEHYHAGLKPQIRKAKQKDWLENKTRVMVCTNAFGMGIDKPDVRLVLHLELPDSLEAYFQEAGRAGRDGKESYSILLFGPSDVDELKKRYLSTFPDLSIIKQTYQALANHFQLAIGSGENITFDIDLKEFARKYGIPLMTLYQTLKIMEREGLILLNEQFGEQSRVLLTSSKTTLYDYQLKNPRMDIFIKTLSRSYGGLDTEYIPVDENLLARRIQADPAIVKNNLMTLKEQGLIDYIPRRSGNGLTFLQARQKVSFLTISDENLKNRYRDLKHRINSVIGFAEEEKICRSRYVLNYFGESKSEDCGHCDICRKHQGNSQHDLFKTLRNNIKAYLQQQSMSLEELTSRLAEDEKSLDVLRWMLDNGEIQLKDSQLILSSGGADI